MRWLALLLHALQEDGSAVEPVGQRGLASVPCVCVCSDDCSKLPIGVNVSVNGSLSLH